jgi:flagellar hook-length control protein FliK
VNDSNRIHSNGSLAVYQKRLRASAEGTSQSFHEELLNLQFASSNAESFAPPELDPLPASSATNDQSDDPSAKVAEEESQTDEATDPQIGLAVPQQLIPIQDSIETQGDEEKVSELEVTNVENVSRDTKAEEPSTKSLSSDPKEPIVADEAIEIEQVGIPTVEPGEASSVDTPLENGSEGDSEPTSNGETTTVESTSELQNTPSPKPTERPVETKRGEVPQGKPTEDSIAPQNHASRTESSNNVDSFATDNETADASESNEPRNRRAERLERSRTEATKEADRDVDAASLVVETQGIVADQDVTQNIEQSTELDRIDSTTVTPTAELSSLGQTEIVSTEPIPSNSQSSTPGMTLSGPATNANSFTIASDSSIPSQIGIGIRGNEPASNGKSTTTSAASGGTSPLSKFQESKLVQRVVRGFEQLTGGGGQVRLRLHPPELGTLQMTLRIEANVVSAQLEVENSLAKDALLNNVQTLRDRLSEQGMTVDRFEVNVRADSQSAPQNAFGDSDSQRQSRWQEMESRYASLNENRLTQPTSEETRPPVPWFRTAGTLDLSV